MERENDAGTTGWRRIGAEMSELFHVLFDYDVLRAGKHGRAGTTALRRSAAAIEIATVRGAGLPVVYRVEHQRDLGPGRHSVLRQDGRLWWPLVEKTAPLEIRTARDFLRDLRAGRSDLFVRRPLNHLYIESRRRRQIIHDGHDETLAAVHRSAKSLLIVDNRLYAAGGVPLLVDAFGRIHIADTGDGRSVAAAPAGELRIKPANGHWRGRDLAICCGSFRDADFLDGFSKGRWRYKFRGVRLKTPGGEFVDEHVVRIDAAFRTAWTAMNRLTAKTRPEGLETVRARFVEALGPAEDDRYLTGARYRALQRFVALFATVERKPVAVRECFEPVQRVAAEFARRRVPAPEPLLTDEDVAALARFV